MSCPICLEVYTDPVVLPCGHSLCRGTCARRIVKKSRIVCPTCRAIHWAPEGVKGLPKNYALEEFIEEKDKEEPLCPDHLDERVNLFCTQCYVPVCVKCCLSQTSGGTTLSRHRQHQVIPLDQMQGYVQGLLTVVRRYLTSRQQEDYWELDRVRSTQENPARTRQLVIRLKLYDVLLDECKDVAGLSENEGTWTKLEEFRLILKRLDSLPDPGLKQEGQAESEVSTVVNPLLETATCQTSSSDHATVHHRQQQGTDLYRDPTEHFLGILPDTEKAKDKFGVATDEETSQRTDEGPSLQVSDGTGQIIVKKFASKGDKIQKYDECREFDNDKCQVGSEEETKDSGQTDRSNPTMDPSEATRDIQRKEVDKDTAKSNKGVSLCGPLCSTTQSCHSCDVDQGSYPHTRQNDDIILQTSDVENKISDNTIQTIDYETGQTKFQELKSEVGPCIVDYLEHSTEQSTGQRDGLNVDQTFSKEETTDKCETGKTCNIPTSYGGKSVGIEDVPKPPDIQADECLVRDTSISLYWTFKDESCVGYFTVYYETGIFTHGLCSDLTSIVVTEFTEKSGQLTLCDLDPEKRYKVSVTASNDLGESLPSKHLYCRTSNTNPEKRLI